MDTDGWIKTNSYLETNTIRAYNNGTTVTFDDNLTVGGNLTVTGNTTFSGTVSGIPVGWATQAALDLKANTADVDVALAFKASKIAPTFTGRVITDRLTVNEDTTLSGNLSVSGTDKMITARRINPPPTANLTLGGPLQ